MMKRKENCTFLESSQIPHLGRQLLQNNDNQGIGEKRFDVGCVYEVDHLNLRTRIPVQLKSIRVMMATEKTELKVSLRYPSIGSLCNYLSHNKMSSTDIYPFLDEVFVMGVHLAGKVLYRQISAQEFDDNNHFEGFWLIKKSPEPAALCGIINKQTTTPSMSQLESNGMVRWDSITPVKGTTSGQGVEVVCDSVGKDTFEGSLACLKTRGHMLSFGQSSGSPDQLPLSALAPEYRFLTRPSLLNYTITRDELLESVGEVFANVASVVLKVHVNHTSIKCIQETTLHWVLSLHGGMEAIGVVEAVGPGLTGRQVGNLVAYAGNPMGSYAEEQILPADRAVPVPSSIDPAIAASVMPKGITAQFLVRRCFKKMLSTSLDSSQLPPLWRLLQTNDTFSHQTDDQGIGEKSLDVGCVYEVDHQYVPTSTPVQLKFIRLVMQMVKMQQPLGRQFLQTHENQGIGEKRIDVGCGHEVDYLNLPTKTPFQLKSMFVLMATEKTELKVSVRCPSTGSLFNYLIYNKYPFLNEILVKETYLFRQISAQEFDEKNHFEGSGLIRSSPEPAAIRGMFNKEITTPLMSQLKSNVMVQWVIRRLFKFLNRQGDSSTGPPQSSTSFVKRSKEKLNSESDEYSNDESVNLSTTYKLAEKIFAGVINSMRALLKRPMHLLESADQVNQKYLARQNCGGG